MKIKGYTINVEIQLPNGKMVDWNALSKKEKKEIGIKLNDQAMRAVGFVPANENPII